MTIVYKIRRTTDGLFSAGGSWPKFTKGGKIWKQKGHLTSHLGQVNNRPIRDGIRIYDDCEIVTYELSEMPVGPTMTIEQYMWNINQRKLVEKENRAAYFEKIEKQKRQEQYEQLKKEFE